MASESKFLNDFASTLPRHAAHKKTEYLNNRESLLQKTQKISEMLDVPIEKMPAKFNQLISSCGITDEYYLIYRYGSQVTHGNPSSFETLFANHGDESTISTE